MGTDESPSIQLSKPWEVWVLGITLVLMAAIFAFLIIDFWPAWDNTSAAADTSIVTLFKWTFIIPHDRHLLILVILAGGLGSFIHTATSLGDYVGNKRFAQNWILWYMLRPFIGMSLAVIFYFVLRGGMLSAAGDAKTLNVYGIVALAGLVGMFSKQATDKLDELFNTLFRTAPGQDDSKRKDNLNNVVPVAAAIQPASLQVGAANLQVTMTGTGFVKDSIVRVNGKDRKTSFVNDKSLTASLEAADVSQAGELEISVFTPPPGGGESNKIKFVVA